MLLRHCTFLLIGLTMVTHAAAQSSAPVRQGGLPPAMGPHADAPLSQAQAQAIRQRIEANIRRLQALGRPPPVPQAFPNVVLPWPLRQKAGLNDPGYQATVNFVDLDHTSGIQDYACGARSYDGHTGIDYLPWPFSWLQMDNNDLEIVAAAPGTIVGKDDGNFDRSCDGNSGDWNAVYVEHADGSVAWYGHMKTGTQTSKDVGDTVVAGEYLGAVGSSGRSTAPHLHFELHSDQKQVVEPYVGACNQQGALWQSQEPYYISAVNKVATHFDWPVFPPCPQTEQPNFQDSFQRGDTLRVGIYYRDLLLDQTSEIRILRPDDSVFATTTTAAFHLDHAAAWWLGYEYFLPGNAAIGTWTVEVTFQGVVTTHEFEVAPPPNDPPNAVDDGYEGFAAATLRIPAAEGVLANDSDPEGGTLTASLAQDAANGTVMLAADGSFTYQPDPGFDGTDSFTYVANDGLDDSAPATVTIEVGPLLLFPLLDYVLSDD